MPNKTISTVFLSKVPAADKNAVINSFVASEEVLDRIKQVLQEKLDANTIKLLEPANYDKPAWSEYQADRIGYARALTEVIQLLTFRE